MKPIELTSVSILAALLTAGTDHCHGQSAALIAQQAYLKASNTGANDWFGVAVAISGDTMVVGAPMESSSATGINGNQSDTSAKNSVAAYVFVRSGTNWTQEAYLKASNTGADGNFSYVAISGNTVVVGAPGEASNATGVNGDQSNNNAPNASAAYVFVRNGTNWTQQAYLKASNTGAGDNFGATLGISADTIVVAAPGESSAATGVNGEQQDESAVDSVAAYVFVNAALPNALSEISAPSEYEFRDIHPQFEPSKINRHGQVAGRLYIDHSLKTHAATWSQEQGLRDLGTLPSPADQSSSLAAINDLGVVAGHSDQANNNWRPFVIPPQGKMIPIPDLGGNQAPPLGINNKGQIVGWSDTPSSGWHAFLYTPGQGVQDLGTLGGRESQAVAINEEGWVVGGSAIEGAQIPNRPFLWRPGRGMISLGTLRGYSDVGAASDINDAGHVVGSTGKSVRVEPDPSKGATNFVLTRPDGSKTTSRGEFTYFLRRPFLWTEEKGLVPLPCPEGFDSVQAVAINNQEVVLLEASNLAKEFADGNPFGHHESSSSSYFLVTTNGLQALPRRQGFGETRYFDINDQGWLAGVAQTMVVNEQTHWSRIAASQGFVAVPKR